LSSSRRTTEAVCHIMTHRGAGSPPWGQGASSAKAHGAEWTTFAGTRHCKAGPASRRAFTASSGMLGTLADTAVTTSRTSLMYSMYLGSTARTNLSLIRASSVLSQTKHSRRVWRR
jgi:hypothetical protein